ncbi:Low temperature viability protein-domain-containing protein [Crepidotus variabilis]|uniref:Low temperature viability protein-domain-containing protein n=1 Tax=Crepidotus variabilis TaxID=179855 RepID=A0A9P6EMW2_9AGAR|nr:Low temperature viability protein-domain-containing protein [Crepidotus variabilis]
MPSKSIFRQPGAKHFQLVHRSQRDPLINDPDASAHVLKPFERENAKKGKSRADLESFLTPEDLADHQKTGDATLYGIYYDDTEYDYLQHLRPVGVQEEGVDSILIEAPVSTKQKSKFQTTNVNAANVLVLPDGVLASTSELPRTFESSQAVPDSIAGFQPDMDSHLRQVLEALEDDAFVDDNLEDDYFADLVADGERASDEGFVFEFKEEGIEEDEHPTETLENEENDWEKRFAAFKITYKTSGAASDDGHSDGGDTLGTLPALSVIGGKRRRRKGASEASGYSMSSSAMYRNDGLKTLDERFDQMMLKEYNEGVDGGGDPTSEDEQSDEAPELITSRDDFDSMVSEFLNDYEILGRKMKPKMEGETGTEKLDVLRRAMGQDERVRIVQEYDAELNDDDLLPNDRLADEKWDCETILTTYTNSENHPRLIRARDSKPVPKIQLDKRTGLPSIMLKSDSQKTLTRVSFAGDSEESDDHEISVSPHRQTVTRPRNESKEDKKARKAATKQEKQTRRTEKKITKEQFDVAIKDQKQKLARKEPRLKKL